MKEARRRRRRDPPPLTRGGRRMLRAAMDMTAARTKAKKWGIRLGLGAAGALIVGSILYVEVALHWVYSSGERVGFVQKISKKGWICKTDEGELALVNMPGQQAEIF